jgi:hypothetical protein
MKRLGIRGGLAALCLSALLAALAGCDQREATPLPPEMTAFVGVWELGRFGESDPYAYLQISADGHIAYARSDTTGMGSSCMTVGWAPIGKISDTEIVVPLFWGLTIDFVVDAPPGRSGDAMRMTVDGDTLTRTDSRSGGFDFDWDCDDGLKRHRLAEDSI